MHKLEYGVILTGGIASGKSTVVKILKDRGREVIDADKIAHQVLQDNKDILRIFFGNEIIVNHQIHRAKLGEIVFNDISKRNRLESFMHPKIFDEILLQAQELEQKQKIYFLDIPLYFETNMRYLGKKIVCVYTPFATQLKRLQKRNNFSQEKALQRINAQIPLEEKVKKSDFIIDNSGSLKDLNLQIEKLLKEL